jgi:hypothetical protein
MSEAARTRNLSDQNQRAFWLKHLHRWHWISAGLCLVGMILFAATGITLNHAAQIEARPVVTQKEAALPADLLVSLSGAAPQGGKGELPAAIELWLAAELGIMAGGQIAEWSNDEVYVPLPRPGGDAWASIDRKDGKVLYEKTDRGWISYLNDLHKGRNAGEAWSWFIDVFAVACLVFCLTGLCLLQIHSGKRPATWPVVGLGVVAPLLLAILFIH